MKAGYWVCAVGTVSFSTWCVQQKESKLLKGGNFAEFLQRANLKYTVHKNEIALKTYLNLFFKCFAVIIY